MLDMLDVIPKESIDAIVCDPPYEIGFMNKKWDDKGIAFNVEAWQKCYEVLKDGGYLLAFGATRTFHRIAVAIEDAGFEIRDTIMWLFGSGFPKSHNVGLAVDGLLGNESKIIDTKAQAGAKFKTIQEQLDNGGFNDPNRSEFEVLQASNEWAGYGTSLKPAYEPIIVARKPHKTTYAENIIKNRCGALNIDECRVGEEVFKQEVTDTPSKGIYGDKGVLAKKYEGRYPANVILTYDESDRQEVCGGMPDTKSTASEVDWTPSKSTTRVYNFGMRMSGRHYEDEGSAARYFYCAKASTKDRDEGLFEFEVQAITDGSIRANQDAGYKFGGNPAPKRNTHPTVKPTELMQYLIRLVAPKGATILDPFLGSGSTGKAAMFENRERKADYKFIGIELTEEYLPIAQRRIDFALNQFEYEKKEKEIKTGQLSLF